MKTVKTYLVRKPSDLEEVMELTKRYGNEATEVKVAETIRLDEETYKAICENPMADYGFLTGKGGYDDDGMRQVVKISNGYPKPVWEKDPARRNEALDCRVYARAGAAIYGLDRLSEKGWQELEAVIPAKSSAVPVQKKKRFIQLQPTKVDDPWL